MKIKNMKTMEPKKDWKQFYIIKNIRKKYGILLQQQLNYLTMWYLLPKLQKILSIKIKHNNMFYSNNDKNELADF